MNAFQERRRFERHDAGILPMSWPEGTAQLLDVSAGGLGVHVAGNMYAVGDVVRFQVFLPSGMVDGKGVIRWLTPLAQESYRCGIRFTSLSWLSQSRLKNFLHPYSFNPLAFLDALLVAGALATAAVCAALWLGIPLSTWGDIQQALYRLLR
ncbi:MAG: PilZ domain-containing protein [Elusimicrobiota bacterium]